MKIKYIKTIIAFILLLFMGCAKPEGCTDKNATNFDSKAEKDCNCCEYEGQIVFWYGKDVPPELAKLNVTAVKFYLDDEYIGSQAATVYWTGAPNCGQNVSITGTKKLGGAKSKSYKYEVKDQNNRTLWGPDYVNIDANVCFKMELTP